MRLGDPRVVPRFHRSFLLDMSSSKTPESPPAVCTQFLRRRHWPSSILQGLGTLNIPTTIRSRWVSHFVAIGSLALRPAELFASLGGPDQALTWPTETFTSGLSTGWSPFPSPDIATVATGQVPPAGLPPAGMTASVAARKICEKILQTRVKAEPPSFVIGSATNPTSRYQMARPFFALILKS